MRGDKAAIEPPAGNSHAAEGAVELLAITIKIGDLVRGRFSARLHGHFIQVQQHMFFTQVGGYPECCFEVSGWVCK